MMRKVVTAVMVIIGFVIQFVSYFYLAAPLGSYSSEVYSNPRLPFAPTLFIIGVGIVFLAAVVYEIFPENNKNETD